MGYECPVCGSEEADGEHLANHLAFTAMVRGGDHEDWLDDHVPDWGERDPDSLAPEVTPHATETESEPAQEHDHEMPASGDARASERSGQSDLSGEAADVLEEARELTQEMYRDADRREASERASGETASRANQDDVAPDEVKQEEAKQDEADDGGDATDSENE